MGGRLLRFKIMVNLNYIKNIIRRSSNDLTPREQKILAMRFGLEDDILKTLKVISHEFGVEQERIRQIQNKALRKLKIGNFNWKNLT